jgi:hypothetical protein
MQDGAVLMGMEERPPGWLPGISYEALAAVLRAYVNGNSVWDLRLCGAIVRDMAAFGRKVATDKPLADAMTSLLVRGIGLDAECRKIITSMLQQVDG